MTTTPITNGNMTTTPITTTVTNTTSNTPADITTEEKDRIDPLTIIPFAALAGFKWEWAIRLFKGIGERIR
jgi:hypothetical protein